MSLKVAVQMDPIEGVNIEGDTSFGMMLPPRSCRLAARNQRSVGTRPPRYTGRYRRNPACLSWWISCLSVTFPVSEGRPVSRARAIASRRLLWTTTSARSRRIARHWSASPTGGARCSARVVRRS